MIITITNSIVCPKLKYELNVSDIRDTLKKIITNG